MDLGVLPGFFDSRGIAVNNRGHVIGQMIADTVRGFLWQDGEITLLPILPGYQFSGPFSIMTPVRLSADRNPIQKPSQRSGLMSS